MLEVRGTGGGREEEVEEGGREEGGAEGETCVTFLLCEMGLGFFLMSSS